MTMIFDRINASVADSFVGRWFQLEGSDAANEREGSRFLTEIRAGITTWAAMAYIISVNASILSDSGGTCECPTGDGCPSDPTYLACVNDVRKDLITATAAISALSSFLMGLLANLPVGMAPGLGLNAYFTYSIVGFHGTGGITYREALAAVFMEGWIFLALSLLGLRQWLARIMPQSLVLAVGAGIGLFIAFIGLSTSGLGVIGGDTVNFVGLGGCTPDHYLPDLPGYCDSVVMRSPTMWLGIFTGGILTVFLIMYHVKGAFLIGIFLTSIISWPRGTSVTAFPYTDSGDAAFDFFKKVVTFHPIKLVGNVIDHHYTNGKVWYALGTMLYVDILDTTGTLYSMAKFAGLRDPVTMDFERSTVAYCVDAFSISMGALMGTSPVTAFIESATGISEGGKTGITAITTSLAFLVSVFFAPVFASIPSWATGGALVIVGTLMIRNVRDINWDYIGDAVPAILTIILIPLTYNIAYGVIAGISTYILLNGFPWVLRKVSGDRIVPSYYGNAEPWVAPPGGIIPDWIKHARTIATSRTHTRPEFTTVTPPQSANPFNQSFSSVHDHEKPDASENYRTIYLVEAPKRP
ncbi:permease family-domain-containing protein [Lactarius akahatsu]|uniref:Permease family-domain-containing protein n=1 Tax=Lactarius akahatsu TaxID=416441 RepID=A0AAD4LBD7_9AGAM|nr:permease family-domain-containing protein [Lactarius akahatsu]